MGEQRQHFDEAFKRETVRHMMETGKTVTEVSKEIDVPVSSIRSWKQQYGNSTEKSKLF
ncbi:hypothetical protein D3P09_22855, partial [Paenibacillus pinisoli]